MKSLLIVGNWKSNKTVSEAKEWLQSFRTQISKLNDQIKHTIVLCVPFTLLSGLKEEIAGLQLPLQLGAQDVSPFPEGAYTGEVSARQIKEFADWVIIGHSERRKNFSETDDLLAKKVEQAKKAGLKVIYCVQDEATRVPADVEAVGYEPPWAISSVSNWKTEDPGQANLTCQAFKDKGFPIVLYGGSATPQNVASFIQQSAIDGVLSGGVSLDAGKFWSLVVAAASYAQ